MEGVRPMMVSIYNREVIGSNLLGISEIPITYLSITYIDRYTYKLQLANSSL